MKLRNKKTGEILASLGSFIIQNPNHVNCEAITKYNSLAELNAEWEDVPEEPKGIKEIQEEAEQAIEKIKAWKRLEEKGFRFTGYNACSVDYDIDEQYRKYISEDDKWIKSITSQNKEIKIMSDIEKLAMIEYIYLQGVKYLKIQPQIDIPCHDYIKRLISLELAKEAEEAFKDNPK